jgi:DNA-binding CsgD family transcriptional regulator
MVVMNALEHRRACSRRRAWDDAYQSLLSADQDAALEADDLERLATAAFLTGRDVEYQRLQERLHRLHADAHDEARAARSAFWLALSSLLRGQVGPANAWIARGQRLVASRDCVERGYVLIAEQQLHRGEADAALASATQAAAIGEGFDDADLTAAARHAQGRALIDHGDVVAGLKRLDETMLAVVADELSPIMTGLMYCSVIDTCRQVYALGRACEWTAAFARVCAQQPDMVAFTGTCHVHRSEILQLQGAWPDALAEACRACERAQRAERKPPGAALYQQAEIHRLRGEFAKAEDAYQSASDCGCEPQPGLALLRMAQGRIDAACAAIRRLTSASSDRLRRARFLPAYLEILLAIGDVAEARRRRDELHALADGFDADGLRAVVAQADGAIALVEGHPQAALDPLQYAFAQWQRLEAPYDAARVRVLIGQACQALGDEETAALEHKAARSEFERLGARPDAARLDAPSTRRRPVPDSPLTTREVEVLRLISGGRTNKEIANELCLSERTIDRHVSNILSKLDLPTRAAAVAHAVHPERIPRNRATAVPEPPPDGRPGGRRWPADRAAARSGRLRGPMAACDPGARGHTPGHRARLARSRRNRRYRPSARSGIRRGMARRSHRMHLPGRASAGRTHARRCHGGAFCRRAQRSSRSARAR